MRLDPEILDGTPDLGARVVLLARLADAEEAVARVGAAGETGAVREFRVALRRLSSAFATFAPALAGAGPAPRLARLDLLARRAGRARGPEVHADWLQALRAELAPTYRGALDWLADRVERRQRAGEDATADAAARFRRLAPRLRRDVLERRAAGAARNGATFAAFVAAAIRAQTRALRDAILAVAGAADAAGLERVRTEGKRLRRLLEPLRASDVKAPEALAALRPMQHLLGDWRDASAAAGALEAALLEARAEEVRRDDAALGWLRPGLLAILRIAQTRAADLRARIAEEHLASRATPVTDAAYAVAAALEARARGEEDGAPATSERRFLLTAVPPEGRCGEPQELEQGWLPGDRGESVGIARSGGGERCFRVRATRRGRPERVEPIARAEFDAFWPLTDGRRIARRRYAEAAPGWTVLEYLDRALVLAVAAEGSAGEPPPWLEPVLVREVTAERGYLDEALARRPARRIA